MNKCNNCKINIPYTWDYPFCTGCWKHLTSILDPKDPICSLCLHEANQFYNYMCEKCIDKCIKLSWTIEDIIKRKNTFMSGLYYAK